jgi:NAD(P)-dependent dehydrogenase (short-subunit alcohol dehydrogenase family)
VAIADIDGKALEVLAAELGTAYGESNVLAVKTDVSRLDEVERLRERVYEAWGEVRRRIVFLLLNAHMFAQVAVLLNNAAVPDVGHSYEGLDKWKAVMDVNLFGYVYVRHAREGDNEIMCILQCAKCATHVRPGPFCCLVSSLFC